MTNAMSDHQSANVRQSTVEARATILASIRQQLASSKPYNAIHAAKALPQLGVRHTDEERISADSVVKNNGGSNCPTLSRVAMFLKNLEAVGGRCFVAQTHVEVAQIVADIITELRAKSQPVQRVALSNDPQVEQLMKSASNDVEVTTTPNPADLFRYDIGISTAQAGIAETGTLVLDSESERHRLVSLVPPVHIAIVNAGNICRTLAEALAGVRTSRNAQGTPQTRELSRVITFITGPSRTADIELTLAIGVHGPKELYVIVNNAAA
jgi:L-lactate dehydrogenase complex protein LldG